MNTQGKLTDTHRCWHNCTCMYVHMHEHTRAQALMNTRGKLYELLVNSIPADVILQRLSRELLTLMPDEALKHEVVHWAAFYDVRLRQSSKEIFQLEAFIAKFMCLYKKFIVDVFM